MIFDSVKYRFVVENQLEKQARGNHVIPQNFAHLLIKEGVNVKLDGCYFAQLLNEKLNASKRLPLVKKKFLINSQARLEFGNWKQNLFAFPEYNNLMPKLKLKFPTITLENSVDNFSLFLNYFVAVLNLEFKLYNAGEYKFVLCEPCYKDYYRNQIPKHRSWVFCWPFVFLLLIDFMCQFYNKDLTEIEIFNSISEVKYLDCDLNKARKAFSRRIRNSADLKQIRGLFPEY